MVRGSPTRTGGGGHRDQVIMAGPPVTTGTARVDPSPCRPPACHAARSACAGRPCPGPGRLDRTAREGGRRVTSASSGDPVLAASHPRPGAGRRARRGRGRHGGPAAAPRRAPTGTPRGRAPAVHAARGTRRSPARPLDDSFLDGDDDPVPTTPRTVDVADAGALTDALGDGPRRHHPRPGRRHLRRRLHRARGECHARGTRGRPGGEPGQGGRSDRAPRSWSRASAHVVVAGLTFRSGASTLLKLDSSNNVRVTHNTFDRGGAGEELQQVALHRWCGQPPQPGRPQHVPEQDRPRQLPDARRLRDPGLPARPDRPQPVREDRAARGEREGGRAPGLERHLHVVGLHGVRVTTCWRSATATRRS